MAEIKTETENTEVSKSGASPAMLRLPYAIAKDKGLSTDGMTPRQVWEMLKGKGVDKNTEEKKFIDSQKSGLKDAPQDEPEQFFEDKPKEPTAEELAGKKQKEIENFLRYTNIELVQHEGKDALMARTSNKNDLQYAKENKEAIIAHLKEKERAAEERKEKIKNIEGLEKLEKIASDWSNYNYDESKRFNDMMNSEGGSMRENRYEKPTETLSELNKMYPRAAAYREAQSYERASNADKSAAGMRAKERIINGEDPQKVIKEMQQEWSEAASRAVWNS